MDEYPVLGLKRKDDTQYELDGSISRVTVFTFYLGKHGPFVLRYPVDKRQPEAVNADIDRLRAELAGVRT